jgi:hypothetical protein
MEMICRKRQKRSSKTELTSTQSTENTITSTESLNSNITKTANTSSTSSSSKTLIIATDSANDKETASRSVQLSDPEQAVNDLLSDIRRQIETKKKNEKSKLNH